MTRNRYRYIKYTRRNIQISYVVSSILWVNLCLFLRVSNARSYVAYGILSFPLFVYALGYLNSRKINRYDDKNILTTDFIAITLLIITILLEMYHHNADHYTINIIIAAFILLMFSLIDIPVRDYNIILVKHLKNISRIAAISLLTYVIYVNVTNGVPMKFTVYSSK